jgi:kynurenine 3-monooxygenase
MDKPHVIFCRILIKIKAGLLLSHLLRKDSENCKSNNCVTLFDGRSDPRTNKLEGRAYALGVGIRGRTAIRTADPALWEAVKKRGYESERFKLHLGISDTKDLVIPLRSDSKPSKDSSSSSSIVEPSLLIYQSELCASLLEELEEGQKDKNGFLEIHFDTRVMDCNLDTMTITASAANASSTDAEDTTTTTSEFGPFDLIVGCDGVNSRVRASIDNMLPEFATTRKKLPGFFKVVRLGYPVGATSEDGSEAYDPKAVSLLIPSGAFIEPTGEDGSCCILFSGRGSGGDDSNGDNDTSGLPLFLRETENTTAVTDALRTAFPRWKEESFRDIAEQLVAQSLESNAAYSVTCNTYHYQDKAVLVGDAAHATGGVSGQGVNSALVDAVVLVESLQHQHQLNLEGSLLAYSMQQVPEGRALYDLSFGPKPNGLKKKVFWGLKNARDALFGGKLGIGEKTLQTRLS